MSLKVDKSVKNFLLDFGLTDKEITVYTTLLKTGPNTIMNLARETSIKRSTTHNTVEELIKKGLVSQTNYGERRMVIAEDPDKLKFLMEQKKWDINKLEKNLPDIIGTIYQSIPTAKENATVEAKYYQGIKGVMSIYEEALRSQELRSYVSIEKLDKYFPDNLELFVEAQKKNKNLKIWEIIENSQKAKEITKVTSQSERYKFKFLPEGINLTTADTMFYDGKIGIINADLNNPSGIILNNMDYYRNSIALFDLLWNLI
jgi:HTH-type transcriptional regulator, sugar sensing transcriptional regulator